MATWGETLNQRYVVGRAVSGPCSVCMDDAHLANAPYFQNAVLGSWSSSAAHSIVYPEDTVKPNSHTSGSFTSPQMFNENFYCKLLLQVGSQLFQV